MKVLLAIDRVLFNRRSAALSRLRERRDRELGSLLVEPGYFAAVNETWQRFYRRQRRVLLAFDVLLAATRFCRRRVGA